MRLGGGLSSTERNPSCDDRCLLVQAVFAFFGAR